MGAICPGRGDDVGLNGFRFGGGHGSRPVSRSGPDLLRQALHDAGVEAVIPPWSNRKALYWKRSLVELFPNKLKQFRRVATRHGKLLPNHKGFVQLAAVAILLR